MVETAFERSVFFFSNTLFSCTLIKSFLFLVLLMRVVHAPRLIFMGTPEFAVPPLKMLVENGYNVVGVYTQPPRPKNRGHHINKSPVHLCAEMYNLPVWTPASFKQEEDQEIFKAHEADLAVVVAYGLLLPKIILDAPHLGCVNIHGSLLPRWRGAAPIHRAMLAGDGVTGITLMHMNEGLDTGDMIATADIPLHPNDTFQKIHDEMSLLGASLLLKTLPSILSKDALRTLQPLMGVTYAHKLSKQESWIDWNQSAQSILRQIKTLNPWPGTMVFYRGHIIKIKEASFVEHHQFELLDHHKPGCLFPNGYVLCGNGEFLSLEVLQKEGGKPLAKEEFLRGFPLDGSFSEKA